MSAKKPTYEELARRVAALESALVVCQGTRRRAERPAERAPAEPPDRQVEDALLHFLDLATDGFILLDSDLRIVCVSESSARGVGRTPQEAIGKELREVYVDVEPSGRYGKYLEVLRTGKPFACDAVFQTEHGEKHVDLRAFKAGDGLGIIAVDVTAHQEAEAALRESESKHRALLENLPQKIFSKDNELVYVSCNENFARDLKIRPEEFAGKTDYDFFPEELAEKYRADDRTVIESGQTKDIEEKYIQDGKEIVVRTVKTPIRDAEGNTTGVLGIFWDITARKRAEAELSNLSAEQAVLLNTVPAMIFWTDRRGQLIRANQAFAAALHKTPAEVEGRPLSELYPSEMADKFLRDNQEIIQSGMPEKHIEEAVATPSGLMWVSTDKVPYKNERGDIAGIIGFSMDITERKKAEEKVRQLTESLERRVAERTRELAESEARYRAVFEAIPDAVYVFDRVSSEFVQANDAFFGLYGYGRDELVGQRLEWFWTIHEQDREAFAQQCEQMKGLPGPRHYAAHRRLRRDRSHFWGETSNVDTEMGGRKLTLVITRDLTERIAAAAALRKSEQRYRTLAESARDSIFIINPDMTVQYVNGFGARQFRRTPEATIGTPLRRLFHPSSIDELGKHLTSVLQTGHPVSVERPVRFAHAPDREVWLDSQLTPLQNEAGEVEAVMGIARDTTRRRQAEDALRQSEERYRAVVEDQTELICRFQPDGTLTFVNGAYCRYFDKTPEELIGHGFMPLIPEEDRAKPHDCIAALSPENPVGQVEHRVTGPDGEEHLWLRWTNRLILNDQGEPLEYQAVGRDITREKQAESALRRTQLERAAILNSMTEHVVYHDRNMVIVWANRSACDSVGLTPQQIAGKTCYELWQGHPAPCDGCPVKRTLETGGPHEQEMATPDGRQWLVSSSPVQDENGDLVGVVEITMDITERKRAEEALRESEQRFQQVAEHAQEWIWEVDADGTYTYASPLVEKILGYQPAELVGKKHFYDLFHPEDRDELRKEALAAFARKESLREFVNRNVRKDGEVVWLSTSGVPVLDAEDNLIGYRGADTDITERRRAEVALRDSEERYRAVFEQATDSVVMLDAKSGALVEFNDSACRNLGYTRDEFSRLTLADIDVIESPEEAAQHLAKVVRQGHDIFETKQRRKDGDLRDVQVNTRRISAHGEEFVHAVWRDITEQRRAQEALRRSEERYRTIYKAIPDPLFMYNPRSGMMVAQNDAMLNLAGYTPEEVRAGAVSVMEVIPEEDRDHIGQLIATAKGTPGPRQAGTHRLRLRDGSIVWVDATAVSIEIGGEDLRLVILRDVTEQRRAREALRESEERYRTIYKAIPDAVFLYDPATTRLTSANGVMLELYGYTAGQIEAGEVSVLDLSPKSRREPVRKEMEAAIKTAAPERLGVRPGVKRDGTPFWVDATSAPIQFAGQRLRMGILRDVTESVRAREQINRQAMLLANVTDAVAVTGPDRAVTYWNRGAEDLFGYAEGEMLGRKGLGILLREPNSQDATDGEIERALEAGRVWSHDRLPCRNKNGENIWANVRMSALEPSPSGPEGLLFVARDVTRQVLLQQRLIPAERMATIGTLALSVSHELNNLLGGLRGLSDLAGADASLAPRLIDACRAVAERGGVIAGRMTSLSRADSPGQERQIDVASVARTVVSMMGPSLAPRHIGVAESYQAVPPTWINEGKILQVLLNLITNARDSIGSDGRVDMSVRHDEDQNRIVISVHDSGAGIPAEDLPRVFDPFFTTKLGPGPDGEELSHLGLGLAESRTIVHDCGGTIDVESQPGQGATFTVRLPVRSVPTAPVRLSTAAGVMPERGTSILVVDDNKLMRFWLTVHLGDLGYNVVEASTGQAAADACRNRAFPYVFLDLLMPGEMDGAATLRTLKEVQPDAKIIIITAFTRANIPKDCLEAAHAVLKKPFGVDDLPAAFAGESSE